MATFTWKTNGFSGAFETAANWNPAGPPGAADDAKLTATGTYTVTTTAADTVNSVQTAAGATLAIGANLTFSMTNGTESVAFPTGANAGQITMANNTILNVGGTFNNTSAVVGGGLVMNGAANLAQLKLTSATTVFTGGGSVVLGVSGNNVIYGAVAANVLDNKNNTFSGVGNIGDGQMTLTNESAGVINANNATNALTLQVTGGITNTGLLEATAAGGLNLLNDSITNTGGTVEATGANAVVNLQGATIAGGTLTSVGATAAIQVQSGQTGYLYGTPASGQLTISAGSNLNDQNNGTINLFGTINNQGAINLLSGVNNTDLRVGSNAAPTTVLTGGGQVVMGGSVNDRIYGNTGAFVLDNVNNTISGAGNLGAAQLTLVNESAGVINASDAVNALTVQVSGGITNSGILEATGAGGLNLLNDSVDNEGNGNTGQVKAATSGATVSLSGTIIYGGSVSAVAGAQILVASGQNGSLYGADPGLPLTITAGTNINLANNAALYLYGAIVNHGAINVNAGVNNTDVRLASPLTALSGGGSLVLNGVNARVYGSTSYLNTLDNIDNTISGIGQIGANQMTLANETAGVINANQAGQLTLYVNGGITNKGLIEATNATGNVLLQSSSVDNTQNSNAGKLSATVSGAHIDLAGSVIYGGTLTSVAGAYIDVLTGQNGYLDGTYTGAPIVIAAGSNINAANNSNLYIRGTISNNGVITLGVAGGVNFTNLLLQSPVVTLTSSNPLAAGGIIQLTNTPNNRIYGIDGYTETLNNINNTIQGSGDIGANQMTLINGKLGVINANQAAGPPMSGQLGQLEIYVNGGVTNNGILEATTPVGFTTAGGDLLIINTVVNQTGGGKIEALGVTTSGIKHGATVELQGATIQGGTLISTANNPSVIQVDSGYTAALDGSVKILTNSSVFNVQNNATLYLNGMISTKSGSINLQGGANNTYIKISNATTLSGAGKINLSNSVNNDIQTNGGVQSLINVDNTISGAGNIGNNSFLQLTNQTKGVINANQTAALTLYDGSTIGNYGLIESATTVVGAGGLLVFNTNIDNTISNGTLLNTGLMTATGTGHIDLQGSNISGGTLTTTGTAVIDVVSGSNGGLNGTVQGQAVNIAAGSNVVVNNNSSLYLYGAINNAGTINVAGGANATYIRLGSSAVTLSGGGNLVLSGGTGTDQIIQVGANVLLDNVNNTISGGGMIGAGGAMYLTNETAGVINATLAGGLTINLAGVQMNNAGILEATGGNLSVINSVFNTGTIKANGGNVTINGNVTGTGAEQLSGTSNLEIGQSVGGAAAQTVTFQTGSSGTFKIDLAQKFSGTVAGLATNGAVVSKIDLGNIAIATATLTYTGSMTNGVLTVTDGSLISTIKMTGNYTQANFVMVNDGGGHTLVTYNGTGLAPSPAANSAVNQMVSAMASLGVGSSVASMSSSTAQSAGGMLLALPHAA